MSVDFNQHFIDFLFDALNEYRARLPGQKLSAKMWKEEGFRCWDAWQAEHRKAERKARPSAPDAERIYKLYPRRVGKIAALRAITKALARLPVDELAERVRVYATATSFWPKDERKFIPHPATWFNEGHYDNDPNDFVRSNDAPRKAVPGRPAEPHGWREVLRSAEDGTEGRAWIASARACSWESLPAHWIPKVMEIVNVESRG